MNFHFVRKEKMKENKLKNVITLHYKQNFNLFDYYYYYHSVKKEKN